MPLALQFCLTVFLGLLFSSASGAQDPDAVPRAETQAETKDQPLPEDEIDVAESETEASSSERSPDIQTITVRGTALGAEALLGGRQNSVTAFDAEELIAMRIEDVSDLAAVTPNLQIVTAGATSPTLFIRGVGLNDFAATSSGAIAVYEDDVPMNSPAIQLAKVFDLESAGTLRGPQGTGPFRNASGGVISLRSRRPSGEFGGYLRTSYGNYNILDVEGALETPLYRDLLAARTAFAFSRRDGIMKNRCSSAQPIADRLPRINSPDYPPGEVRDPRSPLWSQCGENVDLNSISDVPEGLDGKTNDIHNWAARTLLLFSPRWSFPSEWLLKVFGSRRDEDTRLGQSIGINSFRNIPAPGEGVLPVGLGGRDGGGYRDADIEQRSAELFEKAGGNALLRNTLLAHELVDLDTDPWAGAFNAPGKTVNDVWGTSLKANNSVTDTMQLDTVTGFVTYDRTIANDLDFSPNTLFHIDTDDTGWQVSQEVRLSDILAEGRLRWETGGLFLYENLDVAVKNDFGDASQLEIGARDYQQVTQAAVGYVEFQLDLGPYVTLDGGARFNWERKKIDYSLTFGAGTAPGSTLAENRDTSWNAPTGRARLALHPTEEISFYLMYNHGWKAGNYNATGNIRQGVTEAAPETIDAFEAGGTASLLAGRLGLTGALFYYDYDDYQLFTVDNNFQSAPEFVLINANDVQIYGGEAEVDARPWDGALGQVRFGWLESTFLDFTQRQLTNSLTGVFVQELVATGNPVPNSPRFEVSLTAEQSFDLAEFGVWGLRYDGSWRDDSYFDATEGRGVPDDQGRSILPPLTIAQRAFWLHNLRASWESADGRLGIALWVRNLTNYPVKEFAFDATTFNRTSIYFVGDPRTYGLTVDFSF